MALSHIQDIYGANAKSKVAFYKDMTVNASQIKPNFHHDDSGINDGRL